MCVCEFVLVYSIMFSAFYIWKFSHSVCVCVCVGGGGGGGGKPRCVLGTCMQVSPDLGSRLWRHSCARATRVDVCQCPPFPPLRRRRLPPA